MAHYLDMNSKLNIRTKISISISVLIWALRNMNIIIQVPIKNIFLNKLFNLHMIAEAFWKNLGLCGEPKRQDWRCFARKRDFKFKHSAVLKKNL